MPIPSLIVKNAVPSLRISSIIVTGPSPAILRGTPIGLLLCLTYANALGGFASSDATRPRVRIANT